jgi:hypothetical protein
MAPRGVVLIGWGDGAQFANLVAMDPRVKALARLTSPMDRPRARRSPIGVKIGPTLLQGDCGVSEVDLARLIMPKPLLILHYSDQVYRPFAESFLSTDVADSVGAMYAAHGQTQQFTVISLKGKDPWRGRVRDWLVEKQVISDSRGLAPVSDPGDERVAALPTEFIMDIANRNRAALVQGGCLQYGAGEGLQLTSTDVRGFNEPIRAKLRADLRLPAQTNRLAWSIDTLGVTPSFTLLSYRGMDAGQVVSGIAAVPRTQMADYPVVISYNGNDGALPLLDRADRTQPQEYLNSYAAVLAENGFVVVIPHVSSWFPELGLSILGMRGQRGFTAWSQLIASYRDGLTFALANLPVDSTLVTGYGISFGGEAALVHAAVDPRISRVLFSNPISQPAVAYASADAGLLATWQNMICHYETALRTTLIAPREFIWENGIGDANGQSDDPLAMVRTTSDLYDVLGYSGRFNFIRHGGGHATRPSGQLLELLVRH